MCQNRHCKRRGRRGSAEVERCFAAFVIYERDPTSRALMFEFSKENGTTNRLQKEFEVHQLKPLQICKGDILVENITLIEVFWVDLLVSSLKMSFQIFIIDIKRCFDQFEKQPTYFSSNKWDFLHFQNKLIIENTPCPVIWKWNVAQATAAHKSSCLQSFSIWQLM